MSGSDSSGVEFGGFRTFVNEPPTFVHAWKDSAETQFEVRLFKKFLMYHYAFNEWQRFRVVPYESVTHLDVSLRNDGSQAGMTVVAVEQGSGMSITGSEAEILELAERLTALIS